MDGDARIAAEAELDRREGRTTRLDRALGDDDDADADRTHRQRFQQYDGDQEEEDEGFVLETFDCPLREWIATDRVRQEVMRRYKKFLTTYIDDSSNVNIHQEKINTMCSDNEQSLEVYGILS